LDLLRVRTTAERTAYVQLILEKGRVARTKAAEEGTRIGKEMVQDGSRTKE
jgi:hypothetical protein